jgi:hypothetical protein
MKDTERPEGKKTWVIAVSVCVVVILIVTALFFFMRRGEQEPDQSREQSLKIIRQVSRLYILPANEEPTVALITDKNSLESQDKEFYKNARNGDYVLVYNKAKMAFLYRESAKKLVYVSPVVPSENSTLTPAAER